MARRRRKADENEGWLGIIFLLILGMINLYEDHPFWFSLIFGLTVSFVFAAVLFLLQRRKRKKAQLIGRHFYNELSPIEFENATAELFRQRGYKANVTPASGDKGIDIILKKENQRFAVQCKQFRKSVGPALVREFIGSLDGGGFTNGYLVTTGTFSQAARETAKNSNFTVYLVDGELLAKWKNMVQPTINTDLLNAEWWRHMTKVQKAVILSLFMLVVVAAGTAIMYLIVGITG